MSAPSVVRQHFDHPSKRFVRELVIEAMRWGDTETVLDLWGGGESARRFVNAFPQAAIVSCETDSELWPTLRLDAQRNEYVAHCGDFKSASGKYDLVWLDICSQWSGSAREQVIAASRMVTKRGTLALTLLAAREDASIAADRLFMVPVALERATGLRVDTIYPYQTGSPMWLVLMHRDPGPQRFGYVDKPTYFHKPSNWSLEPSRWPALDELGKVPFVRVVEDWTNEGFFSDRSSVRIAIQDYRESEAVA